MVPAVRASRSKPSAEAALKGRERRNPWKVWRGGRGRSVGRSRSSTDESAASRAAKVDSGPRSSVSIPSRLQAIRSPSEIAERGEILGSLAATSAE